MKHSNLRKRGCRRRARRAFIASKVEQGAPSPTLWISQEVFEHHTVDEIIAALDHYHVAAKLRSDPITPLMGVEPQGRIIFVRRHSWRRSQPQPETIR